MLRLLSALTLGPVLVASLGLPAAAQPGALPQTYSFVGTNAMFGTPQNVKVNRNGSLELIEQARPAKPGQYGEVHTKLLYDFQAHKIYSTNLTTNQCTVQEYGSAYPPMFDPVGGSQEMTAGLAGAPQGALKRETLNGIAARFVEMPLPENQGKYKIWVEEKSNFLVKLVSAMAGAPEETQLEIRDLSYAPSPAALFVAPQGCARLGGVSLANGGHAEVEVDVSVPTQTADLATGKVTGAQPNAPEMKPAPASVPVQRGKVTQVRMRIAPESYAGKCPGHVHLVGEITTDGPGTVWYHFLAGAVSHSPEGTLTFDAAGTKTITVDGTFNMAPQVPNASMLASMQDAQGNHGPQNVSSGPVLYHIACTN